MITDDCEHWVLDSSSLREDLKNTTVSDLNVCVCVYVRMCLSVRTCLWRHLCVQLLKTME